MGVGDGGLDFQREGGAGDVLMGIVAARDVRRSWGMGVRRYVVRVLYPPIISVCPAGQSETGAWGKGGNPSHIKFIKR